MKIINNDPLKLGCEDGEAITVGVQPVNTAHLVTSNLDGVTMHLPQGENLRFIAHKKHNNGPIILQLAFNFSEASGFYNVEVAGRWGDISRIVVRPSGWTVAQMMSVASNSIIVTFKFFPGDPTIPPP
jgi:hypothetical protein